MTVALLKYYERNQQKSQTKFMKTGYSIRTWRMRLVCSFIGKTACGALLN